MRHPLSKDPGTTPVIDYKLFYYIALKNITYMETSPLPVKRCKIEANAQRSGALSIEGTPAVTQDPGFSGLIRRIAPF
jgi:hypothetical protein